MSDKDNKNNVEICEDLACVIFDETGKTLADLILQNVDKKPKKNSLWLSELYQRVNPNHKWWVVSLYEDKAVKKYEETCI